MIDAGEVFARIDAGAGMVRFLEDPEGFDSARVVGRIDAQMRAAMAVGQRVKELNQQVRGVPIPSLLVLAVPSASGATRGQQ